MAQLIALLFVLGICALFQLDRDGVRFSSSLWIPFTWLLIACSRPISEWVFLGAPGGYQSDAYLEGSPLDRAALTFLLVLAVWVLSKRSRQVQAVLRANTPIVIFFLYCGISMLWSDYPFVVFKRWIRSVGDISMILLIITESDYLEALNKLLTRAGFVLIPLSILFIRFFPNLGRAYSKGGSPMWTGVGTDKNALGMICMLFGVSLLWRWLIVFSSNDRKYRTRRMVSIGILFGMILYLVLVVNSQTALACFLMASTLIVVTALGRMFRKGALIHLMVAGMVSVAFCALFLGLGSSALTTLGRDASLTGRTEVWQTVLPFAKNQWLGAGYENFWIGERLHAITYILGGLNQAHNGYIEIYLNIGWVGLFLLGVVIFSGYRNILMGMRDDPASSRLKLAYFLICLIYNFTEASFKMMSPVWIMFLWAAMAVPKRRAVTSPSPTTAAAIQTPYFAVAEETGMPWSRTLSEQY